MGTGAEIGIHPQSEWNNPEPEIVLAVDSRRRTLRAPRWATTSTCATSKGAARCCSARPRTTTRRCAIGPFIRLFDERFGIDDVRSCELALRVDGPDGFELDGISSLAKISRDPLDLVAQAIGPNHQYPDGFVLFLGTMFAPTKDRHGPGQGFTHVGRRHRDRGDTEAGRARQPRRTSDRIAPWTFGVGALMGSLARRGVL